MPTNYPINEALARQANMMNSCYEYKAGSATAEYRSMVDEATAIAERQKARTAPVYHEKTDPLSRRAGWSLLKRTAVRASGPPRRKNCRMVLSLRSKSRGKSR